MIRFPLLCAAVILLAGLAAPAHTVRFWTADRDTIKTELQSAKHKNSDREKQLEDEFRKQGCADTDLRQLGVPHHGSNLVCIVHGSGAGEIVVGAHYDHVGVGSGIVDNWSGAALLPYLAKSMRGLHPTHTFVFIAFAAEEEGLIGSRAYVRDLSEDQKKQIAAMVNMDSLGLSSTKIWLTHADKRLAADLVDVANVLKLPIAAVNVDNVGTSDSESFAKAHIPAITIHSVTSDTFRVLHTPLDQWGAIKFDDYYNSYRLIAAYLSFLDSDLNTEPLSPPAVE